MQSPRHAASLADAASLAALTLLVTLASACSSVAEKRVGPSEAWDFLNDHGEFANGRARATGEYYEDFCPVGLWRYYYPGGALKAEATYSDRGLTVDIELWHDNGARAARGRLEGRFGFNSRHFAPVGPWTHWRPDGEVDGQVDGGRTGRYVSR